MSGDICHGQEVCSEQVKSQITPEIEDQYWYSHTGGFYWVGKWSEVPNLQIGNPGGRPVMATASQGKGIASRHPLREAPLDVQTAFWTTEADVISEPSSFEAVAHVDPLPRHGHPFYPEPPLDYFILPDLYL